jgi:hypothetical protein
LRLIPYLAQENQNTFRTGQYSVGRMDTNKKAPFRRLLYWTSESPRLILKTISFF